MQVTRAEVTLATRVGHLRSVAQGGTVAARRDTDTLRGHAVFAA